MNPSPESRTLKTIEASFFFLSLPFFIMGLLLPVYGKELGASALEIGVIFSAFSIMSILIRPLVGWALDRFGRRPFYLSGTLGYAGLAVSAIAMFVLPSLTSFIGLAILWSVLALGFAAGDPAEQALVADLTGGNQRGRAYGQYVMASDIGAALGPLGGGWLYDTIDPSAPFIANGIVLALCGATLGLFLQLPKSVTAKEVA